MVFPELGISAYSNEDLFQQDALLDGSVQALGTLVEASREIAVTLAVGMPLRVDDRLFNCAVLLRRGELLGAVPKSYLPNYREFYEKRQFAPAAQARATSIRLLGQTVPFGTRLLFEARYVPGFVLSLEVCEDLWAPLPPTTYAALAGATVIANLSASDVTVGKAGYRGLLRASQSAKCVAGYLYSAAGPGESTTDLAWDGHALVYENGARLAESLRFPIRMGRPPLQDWLDSTGCAASPARSTSRCVPTRPARRNVWRSRRGCTRWRRSASRSRSSLAGRSSAQARWRSR